MFSALPLILLALVCAAAGVFLGRLVARRRAEAYEAATRQIVGTIHSAAELDAADTRRAAEIGAREDAELANAAFADEARRRESDVDGRRARFAARNEATLRLQAEVADRAKRLEAARAVERGHQEQGRRLAHEAAELQRKRRAELERIAGESVASLRASIIDAEIEEARVSAALSLRGLDLSGSSPEQTRQAKRVMGIAVGRFSGHYLTERLHATVPLPAGTSLELVVGKDEANLRAIESVVKITLSVTEGSDAIRMEGLDGVGREVVRRTLTWIGRHVRPETEPGRIVTASREIAATLDRELAELGRRAFATLEIPPAHAEIVALVGRLNYRTSFTQNQWKHAIEAAFLCGMMANELGLDLKVARRAALMHDIGKALTHEMDGSHAVIGADYARRLGESEIVANAIGAHHTDEPFSSPYAYLVAAADAMSGARPGARRQMEDNYVARIDDLERITRGFRGVEEAYAVQGGREVRIYVVEDTVDDLAAIEMSSEIARKISAEMTFPGQIRVTVIREMKAIEVAS